MKRYRYRWSAAEKRLDGILERIGPVRSVQGYRYLGRYGTDHEAVLVRGEKGTARFNGILWGFRGDRTAGTVELLQRIGVHKERAENVIFSSPRDFPNLGIDWFVRFLPNNRLLVLRRDQIEELVQDPTTARLVGLPKPSKATKGVAQ
jgi:hypothetical protein